MSPAPLSAQPEPHHVPRAWQAEAQSARLPCLPARCTWPDLGRLPAPLSRNEARSSRPAELGLTPGTRRELPAALAPPSGAAPRRGLRREGGQGLPGCPSRTGAAPPPPRGRWRRPAAGEARAGHGVAPAPTRLEDAGRAHAGPAASTDARALPSAGPRGRLPTARPREAGAARGRGAGPGATFLSRPRPGQAPRARHGATAATISARPSPPLLPARARPRGALAGFVLRGSSSTEAGCGHKCVLFFCKTRGRKAWPPPRAGDSRPRSPHRRGGHQRAPGAVPPAGPPAPRPSATPQSAGPRPGAAPSGPGGAAGRCGRGRGASLQSLSWPAPTGQQPENRVGSLCALLVSRVAAVRSERAHRRPGAHAEAPPGAAVAEVVTPGGPAWGLS